MSTPIFDELEAKWNETCDDTRICDAYARITNLSTGQVWFEDVEGNEVFPEPQFSEGGHLPNRSTGVWVDRLEGYCPVGREAEALKPQHAEGGIVKGNSPEVQRLLENFANDCPVALVPKRKFKLFGRNQGTNGTL